MTWVYVASGFASLVYQVAWQRMLTLHTGVSALSTTIVVSAWMLGLGLGSLAAGRAARALARPRLAYAGVEAALGVVGILSMAVAGAAGAWIDVLSPTGGYAAIFACLVVPTALMGATFPLLAAVAVRSRARFAASVSHLYFANTMGGAAGALLTGYLLISLFGLAGCVVLAASINVALAAVMVKAREPETTVSAGEPEMAPGTAEPPVEESGLPWPSIVTFAFASGFLAIGYEIVWYRLVAILVKDSPYAFATVLTVYLAGLALGGLALSRAPRLLAHADGRRSLFFGLQALTAAIVIATTAGFFHLAAREPLRTLVALSFTNDVHPPTELLGAGHGAAALFLLVDVVFWPVVFVLPPTVLMGASVPLLASLAFGRRRSAGTAAGWSYAAVVVGNVTGGLVTGLVLLQVLGTERTLLAFGLAGLLLGLGVTRAGGARVDRGLRVTLVALASLGAVAVFPAKGQLYKAMHVPPFEPRVVRLTEGRDAVVLTYEGGGLLRNFINGQGHGYRPGPLFYAEAVDGLASGRAAPRRVLVVGIGAGSIAEASLLLPETEQVALVELCPSVVANLRDTEPVASVLRDPRVRVSIDDGRSFLRRGGQRFDAILLDPVRTTTASSNNVHSKEFFALAASRLSPGGVLMVGGLGDGPVIPRTLMAVFSHVRWHEGYCVASNAPFADDEGRRERLLEMLPEGVRNETARLSLGFLEGRELAAATRGVPINEDWRPVSEYYLLRLGR